MKKRLISVIAVLAMLVAMLPTAAFAAETDTDNSTGDVQLIIDDTLYSTYDTIQDAVDYLKTLVSYEVTNQSEYATDNYAYTAAEIAYSYSSAEISFTGTYTENVDVTKSFTDAKWKVSTGSSCTYAVPMSNITFNGNGTGVLNGKFTINGDDITFKNIHFIGNYSQKFSYYSTDCAIVIKGDAGLANSNRIVSQDTIDKGSAYVSEAGDYRNTILTNDSIIVSECEFEGYSFISNFGVSGGTVSGFNMDNNYVHDCMFVFHTSDADAVTLSVTNNTFEGTTEETLATCVAATTLTAFSGNKLIYTGFGLQNCDTDMAQFLSQNTYDHGYIYQETVDYSWADEELGTGTYYYLPSSTTVMTILPEGTYSAVWTSDYDTAGEMVETLTYTQQDAIDDAVASSTDPTYATLTWTGGGRDEDGNLVDGGVAIGYNYTAVHLGYSKVTKPGLDKTIVLENNTEADQDDVAAGDTVNYKLTSTVPDALSDYIDYSGKVEDETIIPVGTVKEDAEYVLTFHDQMDSELTLNESSIVVKVGNTTLNTSDYNLTTSGLTDGCDFEVSIDLLALYTAGKITESDFGKTSITVTFSAKLSEDANAGTYTNTAWVEYPDGKSEEDQVKVDTYAIKILKYDQEKASNANASPADAEAGLPGAKFELYSNLESKTVVKELLPSDSDGYITVNGLDAGTYYLVETAAPNGYVASSQPMTVTIDKGSAGADNVIYIEFANAPIPSTGGAGTRMYLIGGACLIAAAGTVFIVSHRKKED